MASKTPKSFTAGTAERSRVMKPNIMTATATPTVGAICEMALTRASAGPSPRRISSS